MNGDFEQVASPGSPASPAMGWQQSTTDPRAESLQDSGAQSGNRELFVAMDLVGPPATPDSTLIQSYWIQQSVTIPPGQGSVALSYYDDYYENAGTANPAWPGTMTVTVTNAGGTVQTLSATDILSEPKPNSTGGATWYHHVLDMSAWRGQTITLRFSCTPQFDMPENGQQQVLMFLDNVTLLAVR